MQRKEKAPLLQIATPRGLYQQGSIDNFLEQRKQEVKPEMSHDTPLPDEQSETISSLEREKTRLEEELASEQKRCANLKTTFCQAIQLTSMQNSDQIQKLIKILQDDSESPEVQAVISYLQKALPNLGDQGKSEGSRVSELTKQAQVAQATTEKQQREIRQVKKTLREKTQESDDLQKQLEEINAQIETMNESRTQLREKLRTYVEKYKVRNAAWKEKVADLERQINGE